MKERTANQYGYHTIHMKKTIQIALWSPSPFIAFAVTDQFCMTMDLWQDWCFCILWALSPSPTPLFCGRVMLFVFWVLDVISADGIES